ncbi:hypothetical protein RDABS01_034393 [Bienertia sinuspersici]
MGRARLKVNAKGVIDRLIVECDRKTTRALKRLADEDAKAAIAISVSEITQLSKHIKEKLKEVDQFGKTDLKVRAMEEIEEMRTNRADKQSMLLLDAFNKDRASLPQPLPNPPPLAPIHVLAPDARTHELINEKMKKAEDLGEQGMVYEVLKALEEAEALKKLAPRQEPTTDSSKYTDADVHIESNRHIKAIPALLDKLFWLFGKLDHEALNFVVEALGKKGFIDHCMLLLVMHRRHLPISNAAYTKALVALCKLGRTSDILYCWGLAREDNWSPDWDNFVIILESLCHRRMLKAMLEVEECRQQLDEIGYNYQMHGYLASNNIPKSTKLLNDLIINGVSPKNLLEGLSSDGRIPTIEKGLTSKFNHCNNLIWNFCEYGKMETAVNLLDQILKKKFISNASSYDCIVQSFCGYNVLECAMDFFYEKLHRNLKPGTETWGIIIQKLCKNGKSKEAESLLILMVEVGESPTKGMYSSVIDRYRLENNLSKASELMNRMQQQGYEPDFGTQLSLIIGCWCRAGNCNNAELVSTVACAANVAKVRLEAASEILKACEKKGKMDFGNSMLRPGTPPRKGVEGCRGGKVMWQWKEKGRGGMCATTFSAAKHHRKAMGTRIK